MEIDEQDNYRLMVTMEQPTIYYPLLLKLVFSSTVLPVILVVMSATCISILIHKYLTSEELILV
jgi:hypothetical protein